MNKIDVDAVNALGIRGFHWGLHLRHMPSGHTK